VAKFYHEKFWKNQIFDPEEKTEKAI